MRQYIKPISDGVELTVETHILSASGFKNIYEEESDGTDGMSNQKDFPWQANKYNNPE